MANYLICDGDLSTTNNGLWVRCRTSDVVEVLSQSQFDASYSLTTITAVEAQILGTWIYIICATSWGVRQVLKVMVMR